MHTDQLDGALHCRPTSQNGKSLPLGHGLPEAPKPEDANKLPRSLRKILAVKVCAAGGNGKGGSGHASAHWRPTIARALQLLRPEGQA